MGLTASGADQINMSDGISLFGQSFKEITETLNAWSDAFTLGNLNISLKAFEDTFLLTDELKVNLHHRLQLSDLNTLSDALRVVFGFIIENSDQINLSEAIVKSNDAIGALSIDVGEQLSMGDALGNGGSPLTSDSFINYLRRYLNDVPSPKVG